MSRGNFSDTRCRRREPQFDSLTRSQGRPLALRYSMTSPSPTRTAARCLSRARAQSQEIPLVIGRLSSGRPFQTGSAQPRLATLTRWPRISRSSCRGSELEGSLKHCTPQEMSKRRLSLLRKQGKCSPARGCESWQRASVRTLITSFRLQTESFCPWFSTSLLALAQGRRRLI